MLPPEFRSANHTLVVSDLHLADAEKPHPGNPLWKRFKRPKHFIDREFRSFLNRMNQEISSQIELIFNGDIFDFDSVMALPERPKFRMSWLERRRGLAAEEEKSLFKMRIILDTHPVWVGAIREFISQGHRIVFVIGNHDLELHWPSVQEEILNYLDPGKSATDRIRFCEWFYISNEDTLIEHGNQYDAYCLCSNPIHPLIKKGSSILVRLPFGNLAGKFMTNGMGLMNPHNTASYIKSSAAEYIVFFYRYVVRTQPFLLWTWFWSAFVTLVYSLAEGFLPALRDPLMVDQRIRQIAERSNATVSMVIALKEVHVHPAIFSPFKIARELWLDRAILLVVIIFGSFQFFSFLNVFAVVSFWWFVVPLFLLMPIFIFYAKSVQSEVEASQEQAFHIAPLSARIAKVKRVVLGHTHNEIHTHVDDTEILNTGTWSPAYHDVECTQPYGRKCFAWIRPEGEKRVGELYEWTVSGFERIAAT